MRKNHEHHQLTHSKCPVHQKQKSNHIVYEQMNGLYDIFDNSCYSIIFYIKQDWHLVL